MASCTPHKGLFLLGPFTSFSEGVRGRPAGGERHGEAVEVVEVVLVAFCEFPPVSDARHGREIS